MPKEELLAEWACMYHCHGSYRCSAAMFDCHGFDLPLPHTISVFVVPVLSVRCLGTLCHSKVDVVEAAYSLLQTKLESVRDFVTLHRAHQEFLATLRAKFYIDNLEISQVRWPVRCVVSKRAVLRPDLDLASQQSREKCVQHSGR